VVDTTAFFVAHIETMADSLSLPEAMVAQRCWRRWHTSSMTETLESPPTPTSPVVGKKDLRNFGLGATAFLASLLCDVLGAPAVVTFVVTAAALAMMATLVGNATEHLGSRFGPGATGIIQSALGNLPELFFALFALRAGLTTVVASALVGSILANVLLVLGGAFVVGGLRHGPQRFRDAGPDRLVTMLLLGTAVVAIPSITSGLHIPVASHEHALSLVASVVLLVLFGLSIPATLKGETGEQGHLVEGSAWPLWLVATVLLAAAVGSAFVADWFVGSLTPALHVLHMSEAFAGFVVVALAGNAVENVVGISLMAKDRPTVAVSVIVQSPLQIIYVLFPAIVLLSTVLGWGTFSLVLSPVLLVVLVLAALLVTVVVLDGESTWLEGASLIALYVVIAAAFWWG